MKKKLIPAAALAAAILAGSAHAAFIPGNLAVYRIGTGSGALTGNATAVFIDEYTTVAAQVAPVSTVAMPTAVSGANLRLTGQGTATLEGFINTSADGRYLLVTGYDAAVGTVTPAQTNASTVSRVIGRLDWTGAVDTSTAVNDLEDTSTSGQSGSPRSAISTNGNNMWIVGAEGGVRHTTFGTTGASTLVSNTDGNAANNATNLRHVDIHGGQLFVSTGVSALAAVNRVGSGTPTTSGQIMAGLLAGPGGGATEPQEIFLCDLSGTVDAFGGLDTLYVASDGANALSKYCWDPGLSNWTLVGTIGTTADNYRGLTGLQAGTIVSLYATRDQATDTLVSVTDGTGYTLTTGSFVGTPTVLASAAANTSFKGVDFVPVIPEPSALGLLGLAVLTLRRRTR